MAIEKIVKCKTDHKCAYCNKTINSGSSAFYMSGKEPRFDNSKDNQIGITYYNIWYCYNKNLNEWPSCAIIEYN